MNRRKRLEAAEFLFRLAVAGIVICLASMAAFRAVEAGHIRFQLHWKEQP